MTAHENHRGYSGKLIGCLLALWGGVSTASATPPPMPSDSFVQRQANTDGVDADHYQVILDRQPFGNMAPPPVAVKEEPAPPPPNPAESFIRDLRMCAISEGADGVLRVGLISTARSAAVSRRPPRTRIVRPGVRRVAQRPVRPTPAKADASSQQVYYLRVGETSADGITLVDASYDEEKALLRKGDEEYWIPMGGGVTDAPGQAVAASSSRASVPTTAAQPAPRGVAPVPSSVSGNARVIARTSSSDEPNTSAAPRPMSYTERKKWREEVIRRRQERMMARQAEAVGKEGEANAAVSPEDLSAEERQKRLQQLNMELIRAGGERGPALPIPLTPEQDAQLVAEGVLPPQADDVDEEEE